MGVGKMNSIVQKPEWLKIKPPAGTKFQEIKETLASLQLHTVCQESHCPNMSECWSSGTATFMVLGDTCTRACKFCAVKTGFPASPVDPLEPIKLAKTIAQLDLDYVVITSVDRDDLPDQGASHFAKCIAFIRQENPHLFIEVLIPDFRGNKECIKTIVQAKPDVIAHNIETVSSLQNKIRDPRANYLQSLFVLKYIKELDPSIYTKSSIMLGLGETEQELLQTFKDLRAQGVSFLTLGQYLRPSSWHLKVQEYVTPEQFNHYKQLALQQGFSYVASGPFVRSSYKAGEYFIKSVVEHHA